MRSLSISLIALATCVGCGFLHEQETHDVISVMQGEWNATNLLGNEIYYGSCSISGNVVELTTQTSSVGDGTNPVTRLVQRGRFDVTLSKAVYEGINGYNMTIVPIRWSLVPLQNAIASEFSAQTFWGNNEWSVGREYVREKFDDSDIGHVSIAVDSRSVPNRLFLDSGTSTEAGMVSSNVMIWTRKM